MDLLWHLLLALAAVVIAGRVLGRVFRFTYDTQGRLIAIIYPETEFADTGLDGTSTLNGARR